MRLDGREDNGSVPLMLSSLGPIENSSICRLVQFASSHPVNVSAQVTDIWFSITAATRRRWLSSAAWQNGNYRNSFKSCLELVLLRGWGVVLSNGFRVAQAHGVVELPAHLFADIAVVVQRQLSWLPDEFTKCYEHGHSAPSEKQNEDATDLRQAQLGRRSTAPTCFFLQENV